MRICGFDIGLDRPFLLIAGPCVIESEQLALETAGTLRELTDKLGIPFIYKSSFDKANRSSHESFRGPGLEGGLRILEQVRREIGVPVLTDVHEDTPSARWQRWWMSSRPRRSSAARPISSRPWPARASR